MMKRTAVLNVVGLTTSLLAHMPRLREYASARHVVKIKPAFPAVTCTAQSTYLTGLKPSEHGIVGNGWYDRELAEVHFWKQSNHLVHRRKLWEELRENDPHFTCAKLFWWYNMYSSADYSITPRPMYPADGRKFFDVYTSPMSIRSEIKADLGEFPFRNFWGPGANIESSRWIAASAKWIEQKYSPTLSLIYLPHLDYDLQRLGSDPDRVGRDLREIDDVAADLIAYFHDRDVETIVLSEYGIVNVDRAIHLNRILRQHGWITIKDELGLELLDCGASKAFAVADHQVAHVYVADPALIRHVREVLENEPGIEQVLDRDAQKSIGIAHARGGDLVAVADAHSWFTYYYWLDDSVAPDFARTVDIHRKVGYDPAELFIDPAISAPKLRVAAFLLKKKLGIRGLLNVIPLDASLVKGSHGRLPDNVADYPVLICRESPKGFDEHVDSTDVYGIFGEACLRS
jgi:predicted AlkP superfamily pyrophosphatase or phosphodiesterase